MINRDKDRDWYDGKTDKNKTKKDIYSTSERLTETIKKKEMSTTE